METLYSRINTTTLAVEETDLTLAQLSDRLGLSVIKDTDIALLGYYPQRNIDAALDEYQVYSAPTAVFSTLNNVVTVTRTAEDETLATAQRQAATVVEAQLNGILTSSYVYNFVDELGTPYTANIPLGPNSRMLEQLKDHAYSAAAMYVYLYDTGDTPPILGPYICTYFDWIFDDNTRKKCKTVDAIRCVRQIAQWKSTMIFLASALKEDIFATTTLAALRAIDLDITSYYTGLPPCS